MAGEYTVTATSESTPSLNYTVTFTVGHLIERMTLQDGADSVDGATGVAADAQGNTYVVGSTRGDYGGTNAGGTDVIVAKYDANGGRVWVKQFGSTEADTAQGVAVDSSGNVYVAGRTGGNLFGTSAGNADLFLMNLGPDGSVLWDEQAGTAQLDEAWGVHFEGSVTPCSSRVLPRAACTARTSILPISSSDVTL